MHDQLLNKKGFSLIEVLLALTVFLIVIAATAASFTSQQKSYRAQKEVVAMQQNLRAGMLMMEMEIRMAGCDPTGDADARIVTANAASMSLT